MLTLQIDVTSLILQLNLQINVFLCFVLCFVCFSFRFTHLICEHTIFLKLSIVYFVYLPNLCTAFQWLETLKSQIKNFVVFILNMHYIKLLPYSVVDDRDVWVKELKSIHPCAQNRFLALDLSNECFNKVCMLLLCESAL